MARNPEKEAESVLRTVWAAIARGRRFPVDPVRICKELGVDVFEAQLEPDVSGAINKKRGSDPTIILNIADSQVRQRFTCAHELGHYVLRSDSPDEYEYVDYRDALAGEGSDPDERFSNAFAASLLMPRDEVRARAQVKDSVVEMAFYFRVSQEAMVYRLRNLGLALA